ncbi:MAG: MFS transporter, partial [Novosphingobium sp.]
AAGVGAVGGALLVDWFETRLGMGKALAVLVVLTGLAQLVMGVSRTLPLTCAAMFVAGATNILTISLCNISVQLSAPRWAVARAISLFSSSLTGGVALGAMVWGLAASRSSVGTTMIASGLVMLSIPLLWRALPLPSTAGEAIEPVALPEEPEVALALTMRSGPIVVELDYRVNPDDARGFYDAMLKVQRARLRNGGFSWSIARDIADPQLWTERFHAPTWGDYLRMRDRYTKADLEAQTAADAFISGTAVKRVRRQLERPFGSVRWRSDTPDTQTQPVGYMAPMA